MPNYYGEKICQGIVKSKDIPCTNLAYFSSENKILCGVHSKKDKNRTKLLTNPNKERLIRELLDQRNKEIVKESLENRKNKKKGKVVVTKLRMMSSPEHIKGYLNIFPNFKHQNRKDGFGCSKLSPKSLGPINHGMLGLPPSKNLENYHQFSKFWKFELDKDNKIKQKYIENRKIAYLDPIPYRHKYDRKTLKEENNNINIPEFSMYYDKDGNEHRYNYLECRYFYCHFYQRLVLEEKDFFELKKFIKDGINLNIVGYDGYDVDQRSDVLTKTLWDCYNDTSKPFGHELVLYTMLVEEDTEKYPWNIYYKNNKEKYKNVI